jgi:hypothetical protein
MKKTILISAAVIAAIIASCSSPAPTDGSKDAKVQDADSGRVFNVDTTTLAAGTPYYVCWMHPKLISNKPGNCPECGEMIMEEKIKQ